MKKLIIFLLLAVLLCGCHKEDPRQMDQERYNAYITYYQSILDEKDKLEKSQSYDVELVINRLSDGTYVYDVIIDNPRVAMYSIKALAVCDDLGATVSTTEMMPSIGILDEGTCNLFPNLVDRANNYYEGFRLELTAAEPSMRIGIMIDYLDSSKTNRVREYLTLYGTYEAESENND